MQVCSHYCCRSGSEHALLCKRKQAGGRRVSPGAAGVHTSGCLVVLPAGPGPGWVNQAGRGGPRLGYFGAAALWASHRVCRSDGGCWRGQGRSTYGRRGLWWCGGGHRPQQSVSVCGGEPSQSPGLYPSAVGRHKEPSRSRTSPGRCESPS